MTKVFVCRPSVSRFRPVEAIVRRSFGSAIVPASVPDAKPFVREITDRTDADELRFQYSRDGIGPSGTKVRKLLEGLVACVNQDMAPEQCDGAEVILIDTEVHGFRYLLVKMARSVRPRVQLSPREQEIVRMVAKGHPNKVIADVLNISSWTVCTHLRRIFAKLGVGSRAAMVAQLHALGLLSGSQKGQ